MVKSSVICALVVCEMLLARGVFAQATRSATLPAGRGVVAEAMVPPEVRLAQERQEAFRAARQLEEAGKMAEAFAAYLAIPGAEHAAATLLRRDPSAVRIHVEQITPRTLLLQGESLLVSGDKAGALAAFRALAKLEEYTRGDYFVEPPRAPEDGPYRMLSLAMPFSLGPGSHRDNWLLRRFIALEAWDDASREFARVFAIHAKSAQEGQYSAHGLQYAIDYAFFLDRQKRPEEALDRLRDVMLRIDLDRRPPYSRRYEAYRSFGTASGMARKEFVRLAYGQFKMAGKEEDLVKAVQARVDGGENRTRRLLARIHLLQQKPEEALALELAYIEKGGFNALSTAVRRGMIFDDLKKLPEAIAEYEKAVALEAAPLNLPDADEPENSAAAASVQQMQIEPRATGAGARASASLDLLDRLQRLYAATGQTDKLLDVMLKRLDAHDQLLASESYVRQVADAFKTAGKQERFNTWIRARVLRATTQVPARMNVYAILNDKTALIAALADYAKAGQLRDYTYDHWRQRMLAMGEPTFREFLLAVLEAEPRHTRARLDLLNLDKTLETPAAISSLEMVLDGDAPPAFQRYRGAYNATEFRSYHDLAYRLMRLYEKQKQNDKLVALGLRIARGDKPFGTPTLSQFDYREYNDVPEHANACLALAITYADANARAALAAALEKSPWQGARAQLARSTAAAGAATRPVTAAPAFGWSNLPTGVKLLAANENVLSLARDDQFLFAGHPWGVAVYRLDGSPVTRIAIEDAALCICPLNDALWVGGSVGLYRIDLKTWSAAYMPQDQDVAPSPDNAERRDFLNGVSGLARDADHLWIGTRRDIRRYNPATQELQIFSAEDLGVASHADWNRFLVTDDYLWAASSAGLRRFDRRTGQWAAPAQVGEQPLGLIGMIDGQLWGQVWLNDQLRARPALIDPRTLAVTPILIEGLRSPSEQMINGPWSFIGRYQGQLVFSGHGPLTVYDAQARKLRPLPRAQNNDPVAIDSTLPPGLESAVAREDAAGQLVAADDMTHRHVLFGQAFHAARWSMLSLPGGNRVIGGSHSRSPRYIYPREDWPFASMEYQTPDGSGGLHLLTPDGRRRSLSSGFADTLLGDNVFGVVEGGDRTWVCTDYGLALLDASARITDRFTMADGLLANRISAGAELGGKFYFATRHDDAAGGLIVYDPATRLFTSFLESDGLASDAVERVEARGDELAITYAVQYRRFGDFKYQLYPPTTYTPRTNQFSPRPSPQIMDQRAAGDAAARPVGPSLPLLGGHLVSRQTIGGKTILCGTRGMVILEPGAQLASLQTAGRAVLSPQIVYSPDAMLRRAAAGIRFDRITVDELKRRVADANPYVIAGAIAAAQYAVNDNTAEYLSVIAPFVKHDHRQVRASAIQVLAFSRKPAAAEPLLAATADGDPALRAVAAVGLARAGRLADVSIYEDILSRRDGYTDPPFGIAGRGPSIRHEDVYTALAPIADAKVLLLFLRYPPSPGDYDHEKVVYPQLGAALGRHPEVMGEFLKTNPSTPRDRSSREFSWRIPGLSGKASLPALHQALKSDDRVVRHNAARACGMIGDPSSIPLLIAALDLESGLSRGGIAWALGELKAVEGLPHLARLYVDAQNDARRRSGSGFRMAQAAAVMQDQYVSIARIDAVGMEWDELKDSLRPRSLDPERDEPLLTPQLILEAVRKIGPGSSQEFYRTLAGEKDVAGRLEAARQLIEPEQREKNLPILRNLLADPLPDVRLAAAVSLVQLGQDAGRGLILEALTASERWSRGSTLRELERARGSLDFARKELEACAADASLDDQARAIARSLLQ